MDPTQPALRTPVCAPVEGPIELSAPEPRSGESRRAAFRSLEYMQKEAVVVGSGMAGPWRLASDEGDYLDAADIAPNPLAMLGTGMVGSYLAGIEVVGSRRDVDIEGLELVLDTRYTQEGSALAGTMTAAALPPHLSVTLASSAAPGTVERVVADAVERSPVTGWLGAARPSRFALARNGSAVAPDRVAATDGAPAPDPSGLFERLPPVAEAGGPPLIRHTGRETEPWDGDDAGYTGPDYSTMRDQHDRTLHLRFTATPREAGGIHVVQRMYSPPGSVFELVTDPRADGVAPDPMTYVAAGIGFCFMTQLGRQSALRDVELASARMVQDAQFSGGGAAAWTEAAAPAAPVDTHLAVDTPGDPAVTRTILDMAEQTCYAHAACRQADLEPTVEVAHR